MKTPWTKQRVRQLIGRQIAWHQKHKWSPQPGMIWFGRWSNNYHHWVRAHVETLALFATYLDGERDDALLADVNIGLIAACRAHRTDGSLRFDHTSGPWGAGWQSAWWAYRMIRCVQRLGERLPAETIAAVRKVVEFECDRFIGVRPPSGVKYDTKMEENTWDAPMLAWASFVFADHPNAANWELEARRWAFNGLTRFNDKFDHRPLDGQTVARWYTGPCMHPDFTSENHGTFHPNYQACVMHNGITAMAYATHGKPVPETILHNFAEVADTLEPFIAPDSTQLMVTGNDWATFHGLHSCLALLARFVGDKWIPLAEANLDKYQWLMDTSDNGHLFGSTLDLNIGEQTYHFHVGNSTLLAEVYDVLPLPQTPPAPIAAVSRKLEYVEVAYQRDSRRLAGVAWRTLYGSPLLTVLPLHDTSFAGWAPWTGIGRSRLRGSDQCLAAKVVTHEETINGETLVATGVIDYSDPTGTPVIRQMLVVEMSVDQPVTYRETVETLRPIDLDVNEGWCIAVANDLHNGYQRRVNGEAARHGSPIDRPVGRRVTLDDRLIYEADAELRYTSPGRRLRDDNYFESTQFDRLIAPGRTGKIAAGETIRRGTLTISIR